MDYKKLSLQSKNKNIIDMAVSFTAMMRVFNKGSAEHIKKWLVTVAENLTKVNNKKEYLQLHDKFCSHFVNNIKTAERTKKQPNGKIKIIKSSQPASYGQAAKVIDIVMKVYVYYSYLPSIEKANDIILLLHSGIDTPILEYLKEKFALNTTASTIEAIDKELYYKLQKKIREDIKDNYNDEISPVQYDDILWRKLNR